MNIVFLDKNTFPDWVTFPNAFNQWQCFDQTAPREIVERCIDADIVITNKVILSQDHLSQLPRLKMIAITATGTNNVDSDYCHKHNIFVKNVEGYAANTVAEHNLALMFALRRNIPTYIQGQRTNSWQHSDKFCQFLAPIKDLNGSITGIIGKGAIGRSIADKCQSLGMKVIFSDSRTLKGESDFVPFSELITKSDQILICCPLNEATRNLINSAQFEQMKPSAILLNTSRGGIVNEKALVQAIQTNQIAGAAMDVSEQEPLPESSPLIELARQNNFLLTPHIAWGSELSMTDLLTKVVQNIQAFQAKMV